MPLRREARRNPEAGVKVRRPTSVQNAFNSDLATNFSARATGGMQPGARPSFGVAMPMKSGAPRHFRKINHGRVSDRWEVACAS